MQQVRHEVDAMESGVAVSLFCMLAGAVQFFFDKQGQRCYVFWIRVL